MQILNRFFRPKSIVGTLPVTLTNGTTADATQVMSDLNYIVNQVNANAAPLANPTFTGTVSAAAIALSGALSGAGSIGISGAIKSSDPTVGIGYATGAGGAVTQSTNKSTGVTLNTICGTITTNNEALGGGSSAAFTLTNSAIAAADVVVISGQSGETTRAYSIRVQSAAAGSCVIQIYNHSGGSLTDAIVFNFAVIKAVAA